MVYYYEENRNYYIVIYLQNNYVASMAKITKRLFNTLDLSGQKLLE